jgi:hypothetical protein
MHIEHRHTVGKAEAIRRIDTLLDGLMRQPPGGITIQDVSKSWSDGVLNFSFKAKKGVFGVTLSGTVQVSDDSATMDCDLPGLVTTFVSEDKIRNDISRHLAGLFPV